MPVSSDCSQSLSFNSMYTWLQQGVSKSYPGGSSLCKCQPTPERDNDTAILRTNFMPEYHNIYIHWWVPLLWSRVLHLGSIFNSLRWTVCLHSIPKISINGVSTQRCRKWMCYSCAFGSPASLMVNLSYKFQHLNIVESGGSESKQSAIDH